MANRMLALARVDHASRRLLFFRWIARAVLIILLLLTLISLNSDAYVFYFGLFFILLPVGIILDLWRLFITQEIKIETARQTTEPHGLNFASASLMSRARRRAPALWHYLLHEPSVRFMLLRLGVNPQDFAPLLAQSQAYTDWVERAQQLAQLEQQLIKPKHLIECLQGDEPFASFWSSRGITPAERRDVWEWYERLDHQQETQLRNWAQGLKLAGGIGRDWSSGYTRSLEQYAYDLTKALQRYPAVSLVGHKPEKERIIEYLSRDHIHNALIIGEEGIGKSRLVQSLASDFNEGKVPLSLRYKHMYMLDTGKVVSGADNATIEARLQSVLEEATNVGNVVLVIPDLELLVGGQQSKALGVIDATAMLTTYLQSPSIQIVAVIQPSAYYTYIKPNATLEPLLLPVEIQEINAQQALTILQDEVLRVEYKTKLLFTYEALTKIIEVAERHVHDSPYPEKAIELLDTVAGALGKRSGQPLVTPQDVETALSAKLKVPIGSVTTAERDTLNNLETTIQQHIVGQKEAVSVVAGALRRARAGLNSGKRPIGSFLFLGPTGVGKTEMAKTIAAIYYKSEKAFIRLDMSEYQTEVSISKLIGTQASPGALTTAVTDQPFSVVLLDEVEKASQNIRNLFLQVLDEGRITDGFGKRVDFTNSMVIATSNAGAQFIREAVQTNTIDATFKARLLDYVQDQGIYTPEWLNRFDAIVVFLPLTQEEIRAVAHLQVAALAAQMKTHNIHLAVAEDVYDVLIEKGYDPEFGARPMRRAIQDIIENALAKHLLNDDRAGMKSITLTRDMLS